MLPLPQEGRPADFSGLVGSFTLESTVEPRQLKAGESVTLTATVRGRGNAKRIPELKIPPLDGLKIYADQPVLKDENDGEGVVVSKTMKWALVPERDGRYRIPALAMSYFDTAAGRYRTLKTAEATLSVAPGSADRAAPAPAQAGGGRHPRPSPSGRSPSWGTTSCPSTPRSAGRPPGCRRCRARRSSGCCCIGPPAAFFLTLGGVACPAADRAA